MFEPKKKEKIFVSQFTRQIFINYFPKVIYSYFPDATLYKRVILLTLLQDERIKQRAKEEYNNFEQIYQYLLTPSAFQQLLQEYNRIVIAVDMKNKEKEIREITRKLSRIALQNRRIFNIKGYCENLYFDLEISTLFDWCIMQTDLKDKYVSYESTINAVDQRKMPFNYDDKEFTSKKSTRAEES